MYTGNLVFVIVSVLRSFIKKNLMAKFLTLIVFLTFGFAANAQHCRFDGSVVLVLDIKNKDTDRPVPNLDIKIVDKDKLHYYQTNWSYTKSNYPEVESAYMRFTYITAEMIKEQDLPNSILHKYVLWLGPQSYRNAFPLNLSRKLYLQDKAAINIKNEGLTESVRYIDFVENTLLSGCTGSNLWKKGMSFQTVYFTNQELERMEKRK